MNNTQDTPCGKTCLEPTPATKDRTSGPSSKPSSKSKTGTLQYLNLQRVNGARPDALWETVTALPGVPMTLNFGESPSVAKESTLLQILEEQAPEKYCLSARACRGILNRAERRGKALPKIMEEALMEVIAAEE